MFELKDSPTELEMIDFGTKGKVLFQLPVLGQQGIPMGIVSSFGIFYDKFGNGRKLTEPEVASAWSFFIETLRDSFPDATRQLARLEQDQFGDVIKHWVQASQDKTGFDPKA